MYLFDNNEGNFQDMALKFPHDLPSNYYMSMSFEKYSRPDPFDSLINLSQVVVGEGYVIVPIPQNIVDTQALKWGPDNALLADTMQNAWNAIAGGGSGSKDAIAGLGRDFATGLIKTPDAAAAFVTRMLGGQTADASAIGGTVSNIAKSALQLQGLALNPVLSMMFETPEYKTHSFSWKFAPDSASESQTLADIIEVLRYNALPDVAGGGMFFEYPSIVNIRIHTGSKDLYRFQPCVINNIEFNYAANEAKVPSFFAGTSSPTEVSIKIDLIEIILNTRKNTKSAGRTDFSLGDGSRVVIGKMAEVMKNPWGKAPSR